MRKKLNFCKIVAMAMVLVCLTTGCSDNAGGTGSSTGEAVSDSAKTPFQGGMQDGGQNAEGFSGEDGTADTVAAVEKFDVVVEFSEKQLDNDYTKGSQCQIHLSDTEITTEGTGMEVSDKKVSINRPGTYVIDGNCADGQIFVETELDGYVWLVLNQASLTCTTGPAIYVENAENTKITLADGTENMIADASGYVTEDSEISGAAIYSRDDLVINGTGSLTVKGNANHGIQSKDDLRIVEGMITVESVGDAIVGKDSVEVKAPTLKIVAGADGIKSTNAETEHGYVYMENPTVSIEAACDGIQAETCLMIQDGTYTITTGGGSANASMNSNGEQNENWGNWGGGRKPQGGMFLGKEGFGTTRTATTTSVQETESDSAKGMKAGSDIAVRGGTFTLDTSDDALHSNGTLCVNEGKYSILSGDDGIHADSAVEIAGGKITIQKSYEGIEGGAVTVMAGTIVLTALDDGFNVAGGNDGSALNGRPGQNPFAADSSCKLIIHGGDIYVDASGDGLDSNGSVEINGGTIRLDGPTNGGNGSLDYGTECNINGGDIILTGSIGMAAAPTGGTQNSFLVTVNCNAGSEISIQDTKGNELVKYQPAKACQSLIYSSDALQQGETYTVLIDGQAATTITLEGTVTSSGGMQGGVQGGMPGGMPGGMQGGMRPGGRR